MASSGNFATLNPSTAAYADLKDGNVRVTGTSASGNGYFQSTFGVSSGKWYAEMYAITMAFSHPSLGLTGGTQTRRLLPNEGMEPNLIWYAGNSSNKLVELSMDNDVWGTYSENESSVSTISATNVIMIALDADNKKLWYGNNGTWYNSGDPAANDGNWAQSWTTNPDSIHLSFGGYVNSDQVVNFGQDSTFGGRISAGGNADGNGFGDFKYAPPTGFLALCSANLPVSDDIDPAQTDDDYPGKNFNAVLYTGNGSASAKTIDGFNFSPDFIWVKSRSAAKNNMLVDNSRGGDKYMYSNATNAELTASNMITFGNSDGYVMRDDGTFLNENSGSYVAWGWKANGGTTSSDSNGDVSSTVQVNDKAGFSIVQYTGNLTSSGNTTVGHGLSKAPEFIIRKGRNQAERWAVSHIGLTSFNYMLELNSTAAEADKSGNGSMSAPTTTVFSNNYTDGYAVNGTTYIAYCWHSVDGYSKFGSYIGNYSTDGPFVYTGFRPKMLFVKRADGTNSWFVWDTTRTTFNKMNSYLYWDLTNAEETGYAIDVLSNGFKIKGQNNATNNSGGTFIFGAWGDVPFKYNNTF